MEEKEKKPKWWPFAWHLWPKSEHEKIQSAYQIGFLVFVLLLLLFIYGKANDVKVVDIEIGAANLSESTLINQDKEQQEDSSYRFVNISYILPMTNHRKELGGGVEDSKSDDLHYSFGYDSTRIYKANYDDIFYRSFDSLNVYRLREKYDSLFRVNFLFNSYYFKCIRNNYDSLLRIKYDSILSYRVSRKVHHIYMNAKVRDYILPFHVEEKDSFIYRRSNETLGCFRIKYDKNQSKCYNELIVDTDYPTMSIKTSLPIIGDAGWFALEDISQQYYNLQLKTANIDSVCLKIDFVGATSFSEMHPAPDSINMSSILFTDQEKIREICVQGIKFHVKFDELVNRQNIRMFVLTSIIGGIFITLLVFIIIAIYNLILSRKRIKTLGGKIILFVTLWSVWRWLNSYVNETYGNIGNGYDTITILYLVGLLLFVLLSLEILGLKWMKPFGGLCKNILKSLPMNMVRYVVIAFLFIIAIWITFKRMPIGKYVENYWNLETMEAMGNYDRAVNLMYERIMRQDTISIDDYHKMIQLLFHSNNSETSECLFFHDVDYVDQNGEQNLLLIVQSDSVTLLDTKTMQKRVFSMPNSGGWGSIKESFLFRSMKNKDSIYVAKVDEPHKVLELKGKYPVVACNGNFIITHVDSLYFVYNIHESPTPREFILSKNSYCVTSNESPFIGIASKQDDKFLEVYSINNMKLIAKGRFKGNPYTLKIYKNFVICHSIKPSKSWINVINDSLSLKYEVKGCNPKLLNTEKKTFVTFDTGTVYFHKLKWYRLKTDSVKYAGEILSTSSDYGIVIYDTIRKQLLTYDDEYIVKPKYAVDCYKRPTTLTFGNKTYFYTSDNCTYDVYDNKQHLFKSTQNPRIIGCNILETRDSMIIIRPFDNPSMFYVVKNDSVYNMSYWRYQIFNGLLYAQEGQKLYIIKYSQPINELISNNKCLSERKKEKLREKLKNVIINDDKNN